jgi:hypothetical protein
MLFAILSALAGVFDPLSELAGVAYLRPCIEGIMASAAPYIAVMDADLQHDERILSEMFRQASIERLDVVIASRGLPGGSM